jgi:hypothetical protein
MSALRYHRLGYGRYEVKLYGRFIGKVCRTPLGWEIVMRDGMAGMIYRTRKQGGEALVDYSKLGVEPCRSP